VSEHDYNIMHTGHDRMWRETQQYIQVHQSL